LAALIAVLAILAGKYIAVESIVRSEISSFTSTPIEVSDLDLQVVLADETVEAFEAAGRKLKWPEGMSV
jgi:hypothetical protein